MTAWRSSSKPSGRGVARADGPLPWRPGARHGKRRRPLSNARHDADRDPPVRVAPAAVGHGPAVSWPDSRPFDGTDGPTRVLSAERNVSYRPPSRRALMGSSIRRPPRSAPPSADGRPTSPISNAAGWRPSNRSRITGTRPKTAPHQRPRPMQAPRHYPARLGHDPGASINRGARHKNMVHPGIPGKAALILRKKYSSSRNP